MNKLNLRTLIKEVLEEQIPTNEITDKLGKFFVVTKPQTKKPQLSDILMELTLIEFVRQIKGGLTEKEILGVFKDRSPANIFAKQIISDNEQQLKEIEEYMKSFREEKEALAQKRKEAREKIQKLKG